jgi:hypothetical protein
VQLHWSVANTILIAHRTGSHLRKKGDKVEGSHLKSYYQHQKRDFFRMSHHKSLGTSSKGEMRTEKGRLDLWISRECCIKIHTIAMAVAVPALVAKAPVCNTHPWDLFILDSPPPPPPQTPSVVVKTTAV